MRLKTATILATTLMISGVVGGSARAQVVIHEGSVSGYYEDGDREADFLQRWNRHHDRRAGWAPGWANFGPNDAVRLLERRGYRVRDVQDVGERYLIRAWRDGDDLLVSVSRRGEIVGVVHDQN
ncbi:hypothetical protein JNB84_22540 [Rhizobium pusense]|uniref:hypothetical protein n=1 Tax=Agrobacterium pusense TaxID=648995 RepID=UPI001C6EEE2D|nr:hypothetical protein [Agrobacterium pusense]MBW9080744.1 hypothetical protein [Agrobacterium pusense]